MFGFVAPAQTLKYKMPKETNACHLADKKAVKRNMKQLQKDLESWGMVSWTYFIFLKNFCFVNHQALFAVFG